jgi:hypothetical protein
VFFIWRNKLTKRSKSTNSKNFKKVPNDTPPEKLVDLARAEVEKAKRKKAAKSAAKQNSSAANGKTVSLHCDVDGCDYVGGSKSVITRHWNKVHRSPHGQKRNTRKANQDQGRPSVLTPQIVEKLVHAFMHGFTKVQAFRHAGISKDVYYSAIKSDEDFADKMRRAQDHLNFKAREVVAGAIANQNVKAAQWWLERKNKDEFSLRREATGAGGGALKVEAGKPKKLSIEELHDAVLGSS